MGLLKAGIGALGGVEKVVSFNLAIGVNILYTSASRFGFIFSDGAVGCYDLSVNVGDGNSVRVNKVKGADPCSRERLRGIAANASDAENCDTGTG